MRGTMMFLSKILLAFRPLPNNTRVSTKMEIQSILIFAVLGAAILFIIVGGAGAMMSDDGESPSTSTLAGSAVLGGLLGVAIPHVTKVDAGSVIEQLGGGGLPDMQVGLPTF